MNYLKLPVMLAIYILYSIVRMLNVLLILVCAQLYEFLLFLIDLVKDSMSIKNRDLTCFLSEYDLEPKDKFGDLVDAFTINGF